MIPVALVVLLWAVSVRTIVRLASAGVGFLLRHPLVLAGLVIYADAYDGVPSWWTAAALGLVGVSLAWRRPRRRGRPVRFRPHRPIDDRETTLYRFFDTSGRLLYVGISNDALRRMREHQRRGLVPSDYSMTATAYPDRRSALAAERHAIRTEDPLRNDVHRVA